MDRMYDYIIVGAGVCGCLIAKSLPGNIALLERGAHLHGQPTEKILEVQSHYNETLGRDFFLLDPYCFGGGAAINGKFFHLGFKNDSPIISPEILDKVTKYHREVTDQQNAETCSSFTKSLISEAAKRGMPIISDCLFTSEDNEFCLLSPFVKDRHICENFPPNVTIMTNCEVQKILMEGNTTRGVLLQDKRTIKAKKVIICAGALNSPRILLQSGIGPKGLLAESNIPLAMENEHLGKTLFDHFQCVLSYSKTQDFSAWPNFEELSIFLKSDENGEIDGQIHIYSDSQGPPNLAGEAEHARWCGGYNLPKERIAIGVTLNRIQGTGTGCIIFDQNQLCFKNAAAVNDVDILKMARLINKADKLIKQSNHVGKRLNPAEDVDLENWVKEMMSTQFHYSGTCQVNKVVDKNFQVMGLENLFIADASIFPINPRINTMGPSILVAEQFIHHQRKNSE